MKEFINDDLMYRHWLKDNPTGYVLNSYRNISKNYLPLHRATCETIKNYKTSAADNSFTGKGFKKLCFETAQDLADWMMNNYPYSKYCSKCSPDVFLSFRNFEEQIYASFNNPAHREQQLQNAPNHPQRYTTTTSLFTRNPHVVASRLAIAKGICEDCNMPGPFISRYTKEWFLEVHHKIPLSENGYDTVENTAALCPNCHRKRHHDLLSV